MYTCIYLFVDRGLQVSPCYSELNNLQLIKLLVSFPDHVGGLGTRLIISQYIQLFPSHILAC